MSFADNRQYKSEFTIKYGSNFPKVYENKRMVIGGIGLVNIYIVHLGRPYWGKDLVVYIPVKFYITDVIEPEKEYAEKSKVDIKKIDKKPNLRLIK
ncbi:hypothetical protein [Virgibacillus sp. CBA3643]|uniref:hypothetical protein n=1 Tax=Virgibacillus sp. CBA3643 TaxID=2942278 RepID=UPI0035A3A7C9